MKDLGSHVARDASLALGALKFVGCQTHSRRSASDTPQVSLPVQMAAAPYETQDDTSGVSCQAHAAALHGKFAMTMTGDFQVRMPTPQMSLDRTLAQVGANLSGVLESG